MQTEAPTPLLRFQARQDAHDRVHSWSVLNKGRAGALGHYALHFSKYAMRALDARDDRNHPLLTLAFVDQLIVTAAGANVINHPLDECMPPMSAFQQASTLTQLAQAFHAADPVKPRKIFQDAHDFLTRISGRMAKVTEGLDHFEPGNPRNSYCLIFNESCRGSLRFLAALKVDVDASIHARLDHRERLSIFHPEYKPAKS